MKKFCSKCGNQLDLGKRSCTACNVFNPFFISGFTNPVESTPLVKSEVHEEPLVIKNQVIEEKTASAEREKIEQKLKNELLKVKEEAEQYKKETFDLVKEVQKELHDIDIENKLLKEKVESLKSNKVVEQTEVLSPSARKDDVKSKPSNAMMAIAAIAMLIIATGVSYAVFNHAHKEVVSSGNTANPASPELPEANTKGVTVNSADTIAPHKVLAMAGQPSMPVAQPVAAPVVPKPIATPFSLTSSRVIGDLIGKKLSGCDITVNNSSEIEHVDNLVLVDKLSATYLKYKCTVKIKQGSDVYTASPYLYYSTDGTFIKVDGINCE